MKIKSLPDQAAKMEFVREIALDLKRLMSEKRGYMDQELRKIQGWLNAWKKFQQFTTQ